MGSEVRTIVDRLTFPESPRWHDGRIWFSDFSTDRVHSSAADGRDLRVEAEVPQQPSGLGWLPDGRLLIASMRDHRILRREDDGTLAVHADLSAHATGPINDLVVDAEGRAYVGEFGFDLMGGAPFTSANLIRVDPDGTVEVAATDLRFPNGSVITDDGMLLVAETFGNRIASFRIADDGSLTDRDVWAEFGPEPTERELETLLPQVVVGADGCGLDAEGALWVADAVGGRAIRVLPGGTIDREVAPDTGVFACTLGGDDGRTLYLCTAPDFHEEARRAAREGAVLAVDVDVPRAGRP